MKFRIKYKGKEIKGSVPDNWEEYTVKHFTTIESGANEIEILSILSGLSIESIENTNADLSPIMAHVAKVFNEKPPDFEKAKKDNIFIDGKEIKFPKSLDFTTFGQKSMVKNLLGQDRGIETMISEVFAIYAQPLIDGKFISSRVPQLIKQIEDMPVIKVFPYVVFFFKKLNELKNTLRAKSMQF